MLSALVALSQALETALAQTCAGSRRVRSMAWTALCALRFNLQTHWQNESRFKALSFSAWALARAVVLSGFLGLLQPLERAYARLPFPHVLRPMGRIGPQTTPESLRKIPASESPAPSMPVFPTPSAFNPYPRWVGGLGPAPVPGPRFQTKTLRKAHAKTQTRARVRARAGPGLPPHRKMLRKARAATRAHMRRRSVRRVYRPVSEPASSAAFSPSITDTATYIDWTPL